MNRNDILRMAREAGGGVGTSGRWLMTQEELARFATIVAAAQREKVAAWMIRNGYVTGHGDTIEDLLDHLVTQITKKGTP